MMRSSRAYATIDRINAAGRSPRKFQTDTLHGVRPRWTHSPGFGTKRVRFRLFKTMSQVCQVTGKRPMSGNNVSHAHNKTRRRFKPNLHYHRFWSEGEQRFIRLRVSAQGMRLIDKKGIDVVLADMRKRGVRV